MNKRLWYFSHIWTTGIFGDKPKLGVQIGDKSKWAESQMSDTHSNAQYAHRYI